MFVPDVYPGDELSWYYVGVDDAVVLPSACYSLLMDDGLLIFVYHRV